MTHEPEDLHRLLADAVDDIEPRESLQAIRSRTSVSKEKTMTRTWLLSALGGAAATAAVITGVVVLGNADSDRNGSDDPAGTPTSQAPTDDPTQSTAPTDPPSSQTSPPAATKAVPVYYVGSTPQGDRLFREFQRTSASALTGAVRATVSGDPLDPDYRSLWPSGAEVTEVALVGDTLEVDLSGDVHDRPSGMTEEQAALALEQVIFTAQAAHGKGRVAVQFLLDGDHTDQVLGQPASEPLANADPLDVLALVNITSPEEGATVTGDLLKVSGLANSFEATVPWQIKQGDKVVLSGSMTAAGAYDKLYPWEDELDIASLAPGEYTFVAMTDDPSGGEGGGPQVDTKAITVE